MRVAPSGTHRLYRQSLHSDAVLSERWSSGEYHQKSLDKNHGSIPRMGKTQVWRSLAPLRPYIPTSGACPFSGGSGAQSPSMGSSLELRESEMSTCGTLGHALEVAIAHTSYMRGA